MRIIVLGSGVIGVTSAYYLAKAGHEVTVIDRQPGPGLETSYANAGEISPGYASPWAAPGIPQKAIKWLLMKHAPLVLRPRLDPAMATWLGQMLRNCTTVRYAINKGRMVRLAEYSRDALIALRADTGIAYDERQGGTLQLFREQKQLDGIGKDVEVLRQDGVPFEVLDVEGCIRAEPALAAVRGLFVGGCGCRATRRGIASSSRLGSRAWRSGSASLSATASPSAPSRPRAARFRASKLTPA